MATSNFFERTALTILVLFLFQTSFCQENYLPGYIIRLQGDTLRGYIDYRNWDRNPDNISFKTTPGDKNLHYTPMDIKAFGVLDEIYESAIMETEVSPTDTKELRYEKELDILMDTAFLQAVVKGVKSLYYFKNRLGKEQFYIRKDSSYVLLVNKKYLKDQDGQTGIAENKKYIGQLMLYLADCPAIQQKSKNLEYRKNSLESLFLYYYKCTQFPIAFHKKTEKVTTQVGVLAGVSWADLKFSGNFAYLTDAGYPPSINFTGGVFFDVILSRNRGKWSLCNELIFTSYEVDGRYDLYSNANKYTIVYTTLGYAYLKMNNMLRFKYPIGKFFLYLNTGMSNGYAIHETNYAKQEQKLFTQVRVEEGKALNDTRRYEMGFLLGLGTKFKKYSFEIRYESGNGMSTYTDLKSATMRLYFLLGYRF
jgi:hypothetical protein